MVNFNKYSHQGFSVYIVLYRLTIHQVLHGWRKTLRSGITKNNFFNSRVTENKIS